jgi:hypothetical protein
MAYTITTTAGTTLASIADGTVNSTATSLTLIGKNYAGYGIFLNENYVKLLENFFNSTAPSAPLSGQLWFDSTNQLLKVYNGTIWKPISSSASGATQPASPVTGDLWYDSANAQLKVWSGSAFITVGPTYTTASGTSGAVVETILDDSAASHVIVKFYISNTVVATLSKDTTYTPGTGISGFTTIVPGFQLSTAITGAVVTGTVTNASSLSGITSGQFLRSDQAASTSYALTVGSLLVGSDLTIASSSSDITMTNATANKDIQFFVNKGGVSTKILELKGSNDTATFSNAVAVTGTVTATGAVTHSSTTSLVGITTVQNKILPNADNTIDIGASGTKFSTIYATTFNGRAVTAQYADLAERFEADKSLPAGTVVSLGGVKEVTAVGEDLSEDVFGVVSTNAAFLMNGDAGNDITHPAIAVQGRVPVRVLGTVEKGDRLVSAGNGFARSALRTEMSAFNVIGRSLQTKTTSGSGTVEAVVKLNN